MAGLSSFGDLLAGFAPEGPLRTAVLLVYGLCAAIAPFIFNYYRGLLAQGAKPEGSIERQDYDRLRASLKEGNLAARLYAKWLAKFLDWIERYFGDVGMADRTQFPHAFGLKKPAPLWTAPAFDRCLLLALVYPIWTVFLIWAVSGHVGPAEAALGLQPYISGSKRGLFVGWTGLAAFAFWCFAVTTGWKLRPLWLSLAYLSVNASFAASNALGPYSRAGVFSGVASIAAGYAAAARFAFRAGVVADYFVVALNAMIGVGGFFFLLSVASGTVYFLIFHSLAGVLARSLAAFLILIGFAALGHLSRVSIAHRWQGAFLSVFSSTVAVVCLGAADWLSSSLVIWLVIGPFLLFIGLLALINAPFDWASLGLTRALLRRGLELGGWWPYLLALVDACLAGVIIVLLALTMIVGVQAFDELAMHGGGEKAAVLPLPDLFNGIAKNPGAPEYWWAYALLLSTMIPSLINLAIGGMAFTRGVPGVSQLLLRWIPEGQEVPDYRRPLAALALTGQMFAGAFFGIAAQAILAWGLLFHLMPAIGLDLLWLCQKLAELDLPGKFFHLTGIIR